MAFHRKTTNNFLAKKMGCGKDERKTRFWGTSSFPLRGSTGANILSSNSDKKAAVRSPQLRIYYPAAARDQRGEQNWSSVHYYCILHSTFMPYLYFRKLHDFWEDFNAVGVSNYSMHASTVHDGGRNSFQLVTTNINFLQLFQLGHFAIRMRVWDFFPLRPMHILFWSGGKSNGFHYFRKIKLQTSAQHSSASHLSSHQILTVVELNLCFYQFL